MRADIIRIKCPRKPSRMPRPLPKPAEPAPQRKAA